MRFLKIGADPEYAFGTLKDWIPRVVPANTAFGVPGFAGGFIGTDGHAETGELRPNPAHNVYLLLHNIGEALSVLHNFAEKKGLLLFTPPILHNLALGGHIHLSFDEAVSLGVLQTRLDWLLEPLEMWFPSSPLREQRNLAYPGRDVMRQQPANQVFHVEYRRPSTWLSHPDIAYTYLAMAKLIALNLKRRFPTNLPSVEVPVPAEEVVWLRLQHLLERGLVSADLRALPDKLRFLTENRKELINPNQPIYMSEWKKVVLPTKEDTRPQPQLTDSPPRRQATTTTEAAGANIRYATTEETNYTEENR